MRPPKSVACRARVRPALTVLVTLGAIAVFAAALASKSDTFGAALRTAPLGLLGAAAALQLLALLSRTEAWNVSVRAAGATVGRRVLYRAASVGSVASVANGQLSVAARIAVLRRSSPAGSPRVPALLGAEVPILATEIILAALTSFTLVGPLGLPWWLPLVCVAATVLLGAGVCALAGSRRRGLWSGLAVLRSLDGRSRLVAFVLAWPERRSGGHRSDPRCPRRRHGGRGRRAAHGDRDRGRAVLRRLGGCGLAGAGGPAGAAHARAGRPRRDRARVPAPTAAGRPGPGDPPAARLRHPAAPVAGSGLGLI